MKILKFIIVGFSLAVGAANAFAQQEAQFTQYMFNGLALNPAYAGSRDVISMVALHRNQWVGIDGAPKTTLFSAHSPLFDEQFAGGIQVINDRIGVNNQTNVTLNASYWIPVGEEARLSFGLRGGVNNYKADNNTLNLLNPDEDNFASNVSSLRPNVGAGLYYYSKRFYAGVSSLQLIKNNHGDGTPANFRQLRHLFTYLGYVFDLNETWKFKPTVLVKGVRGAPLEADLTAHFLYNDKLWLGATYRTSDSFDLLAHYMISSQLGIGYSYDITTTRLRKYTSGSHEILLRFEPSFGAKQQVKSPRYF